MSFLQEQLASNGLRGDGTRNTPLWKGPEVDGITFSLLAKFLVCRDRFRVKVINGLAPKWEYNHKVEYGNLWHICEEQIAKLSDDDLHTYSPYSTQLNEGWMLAAKTYVETLLKTYPYNRNDIIHWYTILSQQFPLYVAYWVRHDQTRHAEQFAEGRRKPSVPLLQEEVFSVPYYLDNDRYVLLRGKFDSVFLSEESNGTEKMLVLQENKTKGNPDQKTITQQLTYDLQTMLYVCALRRYDWTKKYNVLSKDSPINVWCTPNRYSVLYNVVKRPLSGGKGTIRKKKATKKKDAESDIAYYRRILKYIEDAPQDYFMRWNVPITESDIFDFEKNCLTPILDNLWCWYEEIKSAWYGYDRPKSIIPALTWRYPYGIYDPLYDGKPNVYDDFLRTGDTRALRLVDTLYPELETVAPVA